MAIGTSEAEVFWTDFLRKLARRGLRGVELVVSDAHEGLKAAVAKVLNASKYRLTRNTPIAGRSRTMPDTIRPQSQVFSILSLGTGGVQGLALVGRQALAQ